MPDIDWNGSETITFRATDPGAFFDEDSITLSVTPVNDPPVVDDIPNQTISNGVSFTPISLDDYVSDADDPDADLSWAISGQNELIVQITNRVAYISLPNAQWVGSESITFTSTDPSQLTDSDTATFTMSLDNLPPMADAGGDMLAVEGTTVTLDGTGSSDPEMSALSYQWTQTDGIDVILSNGAVSRPTFVTPPVSDGGATLTFQLKVRDGGGLEETDEVLITIEDNGITGFPDEAITFETETGKSIGISVTGGAQMTRLETIDPATVGDSTNRPDNLIYGLLDIDIAVPNEGDSAIVVVYLETPAPAGYKWFKYSPVKGWFDFSAHATFNAPRDQVTLTLVDGGAGDDDNIKNSRIKDPSGIGVASKSSPAPESSGGGGGGGCFISTLFNE